MGWREIVGVILGVSAYERPANANGTSLNDPVIARIREAIGGQLQPLPTTKLRWYLADLESAQHAADTGSLRDAAQLCRAMRRDGVLSGLLGSRTSGLVRLPRRFYGDDEVAASLRKNNGTRAVFDEMMPPSELAALVADGILLGVGVGELRPVKGRSYPMLVRLEPEFLQYRWSENRWYFNSVGGSIPITPGDGRWVLHVPGARMSPWNAGLWPALGRSFINKEHALLHRSNYSAKLANPARAAVTPSGGNEGIRAGFVQRLIAWGTNTVFEMPPGYDVKIIESNGRGFEVFQSEITTSDLEYMISLSGQVVTTTGGAGFSNAAIPGRIRDDLIKGDGDGIAFTINTQCLPQYIATHAEEDGEARAARGEDSTLDQDALARALEKHWTSVEYDTSTPTELDTYSRMLLQAAQAVSQLEETLRKKDRELDIDELTTKLGIPIKRESPPSATDPVSTRNTTSLIERRAA